MIRVVKGGELYGEPVREVWFCGVNDDGLEIKLRVRPTMGSGLRHSIDDVPLEDVPDEVLAAVGDRLQVAGERALAAAGGGGEVDPDE